MKCKYTAKEMEQLKIKESEILNKLDEIQGVHVNGSVIGDGDPAYQLINLTLEEFENKLMELGFALTSIMDAYVDADPEYKNKTLIHYKNKEIFLEVFIIKHTNRNNEQVITYRILYAFE